MVFTLASDHTSSSVSLVSPSLNGRHGTFTAYDIWCAGLNENTFRVVKEEEREAYETLLNGSFRRQPSCGLGFDSSNVTIFALEDVLRAMQPGAGPEPGHSSMYTA